MPLKGAAISQLPIARVPVRVDGVVETFFNMFEHCFNISTFSHSVSRLAKNWRGPQEPSSLAELMFVPAAS